MGVGESGGGGGGGIGTGTDGDGAGSRWGVAGVSGYGTVRWSDADARGCAYDALCLRSVWSPDGSSSTTT